MDAGVYDHIQEEALKRDAPHATSTSASGGGAATTDTASSSTSAAASSATPGSPGTEEPGTLTSDLQDTYRSFTASPWGAKLGGLWGSVNRQAQTYIQEAQKEASAAGQSAFKGFNDLKTSLEGRARSFSNDFGADGAKAAKDGEDKGKEKDAAAGEDKEPTSPAFIDRFRTEAARRLQDLQRAEDAADEALLKFGTNISNFLRDAVIVTPPVLEGGEEGAEGGKGSVLFESKDADGKRVVHATRFDAQLHVIHCSLDSFTKDPASPEYGKWEQEFDVGKKTEEIAKDLEKYDELRRAMEKLVPEKVEYGAFWRRYYFLRMVIESEEKRRREMLKAAASKSSASDADLAWDEDSDEEGGPSTPQPRNSSEAAAASEKAATATPLATSGHLKEPRKSHDEKSMAGSESSYDLVSGATSAAPGSPQEKKNGNGAAGGGGKDESDEEDWE